MSKAKKVAIVMFGQTLNLVISFLMLPYLARALSLHDNGTYGQGLLMLTIITNIVQLGLPGVIYVFFSDDQYEDRDIFLGNLTALFGFGLLGSALLFGMSGFISDIFENPDLKPLLQVFAWKAPFEVCFMTINAVLIYFNRIKHSVAVITGTNLLKVTLLFISVQYYQSLMGVFLTLILVDILQCALGWFFIPANVRDWRSWQFDKATVREQLRIGIPLGFSTMLGILMNQTDRFMISSLLDPTQFALYNNGSFAVPFVGVVFSSISMIVLPEFSKLYKEGKLDVISALKNRVITASAALVYPVIMPVMFFAEALIVMYLSEKYAQSAIVFILYNLIIFFRINNYRDIMIAAGQTRVILIFTAISLLLSIPLNYLFIKNIGFYGPAISSFLCRMILVVSFTWKTLDILKISLAELAESRKMTWITAIAFFVAAVFFGIHKYVGINAFVIFYIGGTVAICYLAYLRMGILEADILSQFLVKVPVVGRRMNRYLKKWTKQAQPI